MAGIAYRAVADTEIRVDGGRGSGQSAWCVRTAEVLRLEHGKLKLLPAASSPVSRKVARTAAPPDAFEGDRKPREST